MNAGLRCRAQPRIHMRRLLRGVAYDGLMPPPMLILASRSPRRARLLRDAGLAFVQAEPPFADPPQPDASHVDAEAMTVALARQKALSLAQTDVVGCHTASQRVQCEPGANDSVNSSEAKTHTTLRDGVWHPMESRPVILAADTVCVDADGRLCGQPDTRESAEIMLRGFFGRPHRVVTGVAILGPDDTEPECFSDTAIVHMHNIDEPQFQIYLDTNQWQGKAGGYNLFDRQRAHWPIDVEGDPATVVGLPMRALLPRLARRGVIPAPKATVV